MNISLPRVRRIAMIALGVAITALVVALYFANKDTAGAASTTQGADRVTVAASTAVETAPGAPRTVLETVVQSSDPADLAFSLTAECVIATALETGSGQDTQNAMGEVEMWIEVDNVPVPVASGDDGRVTFCENTSERTTTFTDPQANIKTVERDGDATAFNWTRLNIGHGEHTIEVVARLTETATNKASADAIIGKRTLHVFPTHMAPNAAF